MARTHLPGPQDAGTGPGTNQRLTFFSSLRPCSQSGTQGCQQVHRTPRPELSWTHSCQPPGTPPSSWSPEECRPRKSTLEKSGTVAGFQAPTPASYPVGRGPNSHKYLPCIPTLQQANPHIPAHGGLGPKRAARWSVAPQAWLCTGSGDLHLVMHPKWPGRYNTPPAPWVCPSLHPPCCPRRESRPSTSPPFTSGKGGSGQARPGQSHTSTPPQGSRHLLQAT